MSHHEKCSPNEVFLGNTERAKGLAPYLGKGLKTIRLGTKALDIDGRALPASYAPIFINRAEEPAYDAIMMERLRAARRS